jgi:hypothetical protein
LRLLLPILVASSLSAQWLHYPTAGVPKTRDGKLNLAAPAPRTADRKPDLTGMWFNIGNEGSCPPDIKNENGECLEKGLGIGDVSLGLPRQAGNIADGLAGGLPYTPWATALMMERAATAGTQDPHSKCLPSTFPRAYALPHIQKFIQTPGLVVILDEFNANYRQIFTDGRPLPEDPQPSWNGYSSGKWDGDTLVVQTIGFRDDLWLDMRGDPLTSAARVTERFRRPDFGHLEIEVTVDDPKAYTKPWTVKFRQTIVLDTELVDEICAENEKSMQHMPGK